MVLQRGTERWREVLRKKRPSPLVGDVKRGTSPPPRCTEISLGSLKCPIPKATNASNPPGTDLGLRPMVTAEKILHKAPSLGVGGLERCGGPDERAYASISDSC